MDEINKQGIEMCNIQSRDLQVTGARNPSN